ncbi:NUDIX domain-containing protein [Patescibacteria group bacterium]|nr:NUDIX domain-containing protein [Patescibacteria group bacterium]MBU1721898.1 NUDIX domain-containing protein [Patescibacteria group bacterium]MBU1900870.1 NUDIX domain-containing protein [Patescibacteria group bacterium]
MRATAVIINNGKILLMYRFYKNKEYYVLPGGGVEKDEQVEAAVVREIKEETNLDIKVDKKLWEFIDDFDKRTHHFFLVTKFKGNMQLGGPEVKRNSDTDKYLLEWHYLSNLSELLIYPNEIKEFLKNLL